MLKKGQQSTFLTKISVIWRKWPWIYRIPRANIQSLFGCI